MPVLFTPQLSLRGSWLNTKTLHHDSHGRWVSGTCFKVGAPNADADLQERVSGGDLCTYLRVAGKFARCYRTGQQRIITVGTIVFCGDFPDVKVDI